MSVGNGASFDPHLDVHTATFVGRMSLSWQESCLSKGLIIVMVVPRYLYTCSERGLVNIDKLHNA